jgi:hypothetical protein
MEMKGSVGMVLATTSATAGEREMAVPQPAKARREVRTEVARE